MQSNQNRETNLKVYQNSKIIKEFPLNFSIPECNIESPEIQFNSLEFHTNTWEASSIDVLLLMLLIKVYNIQQKRFKLS